MFKLYDLFRKSHQELLNARPNDNTAALLLAAYPKLNAENLAFPLDAAKAWSQTQDLINWCEQYGIAALQFVDVAEYPGLATLTYTSKDKLWEHFHKIKIGGANIFESKLQIQQGAALHPTAFLEWTFHLGKPEDFEAYAKATILKQKSVYTLIFKDGFQTADLYPRQQQIDLEVQRRFGNNLDAYFLILQSQL
jgi:hypothetical protein